jgi:hypothetical protein
VDACEGGEGFKFSRMLVKLPNNVGQTTNYLIGKLTAVQFHRYASYKIPNPVSIETFYYFVYGTFVEFLLLLLFLDLFHKMISNEN